MALNKHQIFAAQDTETTSVFIKEWDGEVKIKKMNISEHLAFTNEINDDTSEIDCMFKLMKYAVIDDEGKYLFSSQHDLDELQKKNRTAIEQLFEAVCKINSLGNKDEIEKKAKN